MRNNMQTGTWQECDELLETQIKTYLGDGFSDIIIYENSITIKYNCNEELRIISDKGICKKLYSDVIEAFCIDFSSKNGHTNSSFGTLYGFSVRCRVVYDEPHVIYIRALQVKECSRIAEIRRKENITQSQLAIRAGVSISSIREYEQNPKSLYAAQFQTVCAICEVLGCSMEELTGITNSFEPVLEELYPGESMNEPIEIIKTYIESTRNPCVCITGSVGSGTTTLANCIASYIQDSKIIGDAVVVSEQSISHGEGAYDVLRILYVSLSVIDSQRLIKEIFMAGHGEMRKLWSCQIDR